MGGCLPIAHEADTWTFTDNLAKIWRSEGFKTGQQSAPNEVFAGKLD